MTHTVVLLYTIQPSTHSLFPTPSLAIPTTSFKKRRSRESHRRLTTATRPIVSKPPPEIFIALKAEHGLAVTRSGSSSAGHAFWGGRATGKEKITFFRPGHYRFGSGRRTNSLTLTDACHSGLISGEKSFIWDFDALVLFRCLDSMKIVINFSSQESVSAV